VAEVTLKTRREEDEVGCQVDYADSQHLATNETATPRGANFSVRNLFYNVPARRKFLKSDSIEFKHIVTEFIRVALTRPDIGFTLTHNGKDVYVLRPAKSLKFRIQDVLGAAVAGEVVDVHAQTSVVSVTGYAGRPASAKKTLGNQYLFVNGRYFRSPYLHKAVMKAYENLIPEGSTPSYFLYLEVDPQSVDVNIHPTKTEIKFEDDSVIFQIVFACIKEALGRNSFDAIDFENKEIELPVISRNFEEFRSVSELPTDADPTFNPFDNDGFPSEQSPYTNSFGGMQSVPAVSGLHMPSSSGTSRFVERRDDYGKLFEDKLAPTKSILTIQGKYILTSARSGLMIVNIQRAMERIMYDRFLDALSKNSHAVQTALFPVTVYVGVENMCLFEEHSQLLYSLGFDIAPFGTDTIVVNGVPEGYSAEAGKVQSMMSDLILVLSDDYSALEEMMTANLAARLARLGSFNGDSVTNPAEAQRLIDALLSCENAEFTSSGKKIISIVPVDEIDKRF
jgi:DNA mismatch repair protein MutL